MTPNKRSDLRCNAKTKAGKTCQAAATPGGLCFFHANPKKASELGRIGGRTRRSRASENSDPVATLDNALAVRDLIARLISDLYQGKVNPRIAAGLAQLLNLQMRVIEMTDLLLRVEKMEKQLAQLQQLEGI